MAGNVWEWVADEFRVYATGDQSEKNQEIREDSRILRGGSWGYTPSFLRTSYRYRVPADADYLAVGFRCAFPIAEEKSD
jgi:formylglycine-generating enzyme required for sulfatase activity